jgi:uncharacterized protein (DUF983 family)
MLGKGSKMYSILHGVCPRCQGGKMFKYGPYQRLEFTQMNERCVSCGQTFEPEPDFYQGGMYVSYALSTGLFMVIGVICLFYLELSFLISFSIIGVVAIILLPVIFRVSRVVWLNIFVNYKPLSPGLNSSKGKT